MSASDSATRGGIAIVGMAGRFPGARSTAELWDNVKNGVDSIEHFGDDKLDLEPHPDSPDVTPTYVRAKGVVEDADCFDAKFFGYIPKEAAVMDPQHRLFLESAWHALEDAGCDPRRYGGSIGVWAGCYFDTYLLSNLATDPSFLARFIESIQVGTLQTELGNDKDYLATRVAYKLDLRGPAMTLQTACSTSLVAICQACSALETYQADMALAGGVTLTFPQYKGYYHREGGMLSPDGRCRAFDHRAAGTVFSNGVGVIALKREADAIADGDSIYAVIRGYATNNDGSGKVSYTAPSVMGQAEVVALAQAVADFDAGTIGLIEAHGTATPLGDPIEIEALTRAFRRTTDRNGFCAIGSIKTNLGHLDVASGVTGVIKAALSVRDGVLPPSLHFEKPNPKIDFDATPFYVNTQLQPWPTDGPRRAGISGFGVGGTNAHVVLEQPLEPMAQSTSARGPQVLVLSAATEEALSESAGQLADVLEVRDFGGGNELGSVARTLQEGRRKLDHRRFVVAENGASAAEVLRSSTAGASAHSGPARSQAGDGVVFLLPGQGSQYPGMAATLRSEFSVFAECFDRCLEVASDFLRLDLASIVLPDAKRSSSAAADALRQTTVAQPAIFAVEVALARLWRELGVEPVALIGHSVGEIAAATIAGALDLEEAVRLVARRGELMQSLPGGEMLSVRTDEEQLAAVIAQLRGEHDVTLDVAAVNSPQLTVASGDERSVLHLERHLESIGVACSRLHTSHAFHSEMMGPATQPTVAVAEGLGVAALELPIFSTVTCRELARGSSLEPDYWGRNLRETVRFSPALEALADTGDYIYLEVGPGQTLTTLARQTLPAGVVAIPSMAHPKQARSDAWAFAEACGRLWLHDVEVHWAHLHGEPTKVHLPGYPFERKRHWIEPGPTLRTDPAMVESGEAAIARPETPQDHGDNGQQVAPMHNGAGCSDAERAEDVTGAERLVLEQLDVLRMQLEALGARGPVRDAESILGSGGE